jgi:hypothetical protein
MWLKQLYSSGPSLKQIVEDGLKEKVCHTELASFAVMAWVKI